MKYKLKLFALVLLVPFISISQTDTSKVGKLPNAKPSFNGFATFGLGRSIPKGLLALQDIESDSAGLALNGLDIKLSVGYLFNKQIGLCATYFNQSFGINTNAINNHLSKLYAPSSFSSQVTSGWKLKGMVVGIYGRVAIDENKTFFLEPRAMIGLATGQSPNFSITEYIKNTGGTTPYFTSHQGSGTSDPIVSYMVGGTLKLELGQKFCAGVTVDYLGLLEDTKYDNVQISYSTNVGANPPSETVSFKQEMRSIAISVGIGFRFGKRLLFQ